MAKGCFYYEIQAWLKDTGWTRVGEPIRDMEPALKARAIYEDAIVEYPTLTLRFVEVRVIEQRNSNRR